jgi:hypothetical protein
MSEYIEWGALLNIVIFGVIIGAGLPMIYAVGVRSLDASAKATGSSATIRKVGAYASFGVVVAAIVFAIGFIIAGGH